MRVLVAEKDAALADCIKEQLECEHYETDVVHDDAATLSAIEARRYELGLISIDPAADIVAQARAVRPELLLLVLSAQSDPTSHARCLDAGADDFISKPFYFSVLLAHFRALLRRRNNAANPVLALEDLELNRVRRTVKRNGYTIDFTQKEFALLEFLMERPMQPVSRAAIARNAWNLEDDGTPMNSVDVYVNYVRKKLETYGDRPIIRTVRGVGYQIGGGEVTTG